MKEAEIVVSNCLIGALDPPTNTEGVVRSVMVMEKGDEKDGKICLFYVNCFMQVNCLGSQIFLFS